MHIAAFDTGSLGALAVVGSGIPLAVGAALAFKMRGEDRVAVPFTGDGGSNTGNWHESVNMAAIWDLPVVFALENNQYAVSTNIKDTVKVNDLSRRAQAYGIPGVRVDGFDVIAVYEAATQAVERARSGQGPTLLVTEAYRFEGHYAGEPEVYREKEEVLDYRKKDPIARFREHLLQARSIPDERLDKIDLEVKQELEDAVLYAMNSAQPDASSAMDFIYA
jgi:TPP-dependent pyruvate/acetoin dehydrogenase alpha subunit